MLRIALMGSGLRVLEQAMRDLQRFASLVWITSLLLGLSVPALAQQECDDNLPVRADAMAQAIEQAKSCRAAAAIWRKCPFGASADVALTSYIINKCEKSFLDQLSPAGKQRYEEEMQLCIYQYSQQQGTLWMSKAAGCQVDVATRFAANSGAAGGPARTASFDCHRARSLLEKAICSDIRLGHADIVLSRVFAEVLNTHKNERLALVQNDKKWRRSLSATCRFSAIPLEEDSLNCLLKEFEQRFTAFNWCLEGIEGNDCSLSRGDEKPQDSSATAARQEKEAGPLIDAAFAFANRAGTELLVTDENASENNAVVKTFSKAVCPGSKVLDVRFVSHQSRAEEDSGRATSRNFNNIAGSVFHIVQGKVEADEACLLAPETYIKDARPLPMKVTKAKIKAKQNRQDGALRCDARTKGGLARQQRRAPKDCWQLAPIDPDGRLLAVLYEPRQEDLLAALVLEVGEKHFVYEMPAKADPNSSWRAGDEGHFDPTTLAPLFVLENHRDGSWVIGISWAGEEGAKLGAYCSTSASRLKKVVSGYVYWYPE